MVRDDQAGGLNSDRKWLSDRDANEPLPILGGAVLKRTLIELFATLR